MLLNFFEFSGFGSLRCMFRKLGFKVQISSQEPKHETSDDLGLKAPNGHDSPKGKRTRKQRKRVKVTGQGREEDRGEENGFKDHMNFNDQAEEQAEAPLSEESQVTDDHQKPEELCKFGRRSTWRSGTCFGSLRNFQPTNSSIRSTSSSG